jgi:F-type H+-transporting ATPase subunit epsilon
MAGTLSLRVVTPERAVFEGEVASVVVPGHDGEIGILPRHAAFLGAVGVGELRATTANGVQRFLVEDGFVQVRDNRVTVLCARAARLADVDRAAAETAAAAAARARSERRPEAAALQQRAAVIRRLTAAGRGGGSH